MGRRDDDGAARGGARGDRPARRADDLRDGERPRRPTRRTDEFGGGARGDRPYRPARRTDDVRDGERPRRPPRSTDEFGRGDRPPRSGRPGGQRSDGARTGRRTGGPGGYPRSGDGARGHDAGAGAERLDIPDSIDAGQLDPTAMAELRTLPGDLAEVIARLLVATAVADDADKAYSYAKQARGLAARVGVVRETCAIAAYQAGDWAGALAEFRAARRLTGRDSYLPLMADCERALGRLDRALDLVTSPEARAADRETQIELRIVESGIRRDQGLRDAAVLALEGPELTARRIRPEHARLYYAYADALLAAGRDDEARGWFGRAASADVDDETDAAERFEELDDFIFDDLGDDEQQDELEEDGDDTDSA